MSTKRKADGHSRAASRPHTMKSGDSRTDSERDSGFSDANSEHMSAIDNNDSEDSPSLVVKQGSGPQSSQVAVVGGSYSGLSPMIIMNNVLLKQPQDNPPTLKPWGFSPTVEVVQPVVQQPQVVFLQPVVSRRASSKEASSRHRRPKKYLPILKSYPKIAPHPGDSSSSSGRGTATSSSSSSTTSTSSHSSSSSSSGSERGSSRLTSNHWEHCSREKQKLNVDRCGGASNSGSTTPSLPAAPSTTSPLLQSRLSVPTTVTSGGSSPASERSASVFSQAESVSHSTGPVPHTVNQESRSSEGCKHSDSDAETKRKRFCNTYNILSNSGLLDIALRTKELHRQNRRTQSDLDRLKEQTELFCQALCSGDTSIYANLLSSLQEEDRDRERERAAQTSSKAD